MVQKRERRRQLVVNSPLQSRIVVSISWPIVACLATTAALLAWFGNKVATQATEAGVPLPGLTPLLVTISAFMACSTAYMVWHFLKMSHRVVGPMFRIQQTLDFVRMGDTRRRVQLRDGDFLAETAEHINLLLDWLEERVPPTRAAGDAGGPQGKVTADRQETAETTAPERVESE